MIQVVNPSFSRELKTEFKQLKNLTDSGSDLAANLSRRFDDVSESMKDMTGKLFHDTESRVNLQEWFQTNVVNAFKNLAEIKAIKKEEVANVTEAAIGHFADGITKAVAALHQPIVTQLNNVDKAFQNTQRADNDSKSYWIKGLPRGESVTTLIEKLAQGTVDADHYTALANVINPNPNVAINHKVAEDPKLRALFTLLLDKVKQIPETDFAQFAKEDSIAALFHAIDSSGFAPEDFKAADWDSIFDEPQDLSNADFMQIFYSLLQCDKKIAQNSKSSEARFSSAMRFLNLVQGYISQSACGNLLRTR